MNRYRDSRRLGAHWHVDCRLEGELPEHHLVSPRFFVNVLFGSVSLALLLVFGWLSYRTFNLTKQVHDWNQRIKDTATEVQDIQRMQREYVAEASKIDQAYGVIRPALSVSEFMEILARTLPEQINVDVLEWTENDIVMRGVLRETSQRASRLLGEYVEMLKKDARIGPRFRGITLTGFERAKGKEEMQSFGITFRLQALPPL